MDDTLWAMAAVISTKVEKKVTLVIGAKSKEEALGKLVADNIGWQIEGHVSAPYMVPRLTALTIGEWKMGTRLRKKSGSSWQGKVVGYYSTDLTPVGYAIESEREPGSVQIYPAGALELVEG